MENNPDLGRNWTIQNLLIIFLIWLILLLMAGYIGLSLHDWAGTRCQIRHELPFYRWDSFWYTSIARHGYFFSTSQNSSVAFFPFYPFVISLFLWLPLHPDKISFILNIIFSVLTVFFLYRLGRFDYKDETSFLIVLFWLLFPPAYFLISGYPEALFVLLAVLSLYFARKQNWLLAGVSAGLLAITKPYGIFMLPAIILEYLKSYKWQWKVALKNLYWIYFLIPVATLSGYIYFNWTQFHDPLAFLHAEKTWGRVLGDPISALLAEGKFYLGSGHIFSGANFPYLIYLLSFIFSIFCVWASWRYVRKTYLIFPALILLTAFFTGTLTSWGRYMFLGFPILIGPAVWLAKRPKLYWTYLFCSGLLLFFLANLFARCYPVE